jgi:autotransporter-associated beta strand protein
LKVTSGTTTLGGTNTFTGGTTIANLAILAMNSATALGTGNVTGTGGSLSLGSAITGNVTAGALACITENGNGVSLYVAGTGTNSVEFTGGMTMTSTNGAGLYATGANAVIVDSLVNTFTAKKTLELYAANATSGGTINNMTVPGGDSAINVIISKGTWTFGGNNTIPDSTGQLSVYSGSTAIISGTTYASIASTGTIDILSGATLTEGYNNGGNSWGGTLTGAGTVNDTTNKLSPYASAGVGATITPGQNGVGTLTFTRAPNFNYNCPYTNLAETFSAPAANGATTVGTMAILAADGTPPPWIYPSLPSHSVARPTSPTRARRR